MWSPFSIVVGLVLVFRDFAQREIGHYIFVPLIIGVSISFFMAPPEIALASGIAFAVSEVADWMVYTFTKRPLSQRVLISSCIGVPIDSVIYLTGASAVVPGIFTGWVLGSMIVSKLSGALFVFYVIRKRELKGLQ